MLQKLTKLIKNIILKYSHQKESEQTILKEKTVNETTLEIPKQTNSTKQKKDRKLPFQHTTETNCGQTKKENDSGQIVLTRRKDGYSVTVLTSPIQKEKNTTTKRSQKQNDLIGCGDTETTKKTTASKNMRKIEKN